MDGIVKRCMGFKNERRPSMFSERKVTCGPNHSTAHNFVEQSLERNSSLKINSITVK